jgi:hypothetical protein
VAEESPLIDQALTLVTPAQMIAPMMRAFHELNRQGGLSRDGMLAYM